LGVQRLSVRQAAKATAAALLVVAGVTAQAAEPATLTLACQGTTISSLENAKPEPVSMGIIVNFTNRTVQGFGYPVNITDVDEVTVSFNGFSSLSSTRWHTDGFIDRVTGDLYANSLVQAVETSKIVTSTIYSLKCRPTQRMF
jgi:hypothetical protein